VERKKFSLAYMYILAIIRDSDVGRTFFVKLIKPKKI
jgi:hypothetical protein